MAKIFRTEELSVNGDNIRISAEAGNLIFKDGSGNKVTSTDDRTQEVSSLAFKDLDLDSDVSSLKTEISDSVDAANTDLNADISSLQAQRTSDVSDLDGDVSSLQAQRTSDVSDLDGDVSSLQAQRTSDVSDLDGDVSSLAYLASQNDVIKASVAIDIADNMGDSSYDATNARVTVDFGRTFLSAPSVVGIMKAAAGQPIIGVQLIDISTTNAQFQLSDDVAVDGTYTIEVLASI